MTKQKEIIEDIKSILEMISLYKLTKNQIARLRDIESDLINLFN